MPLKQSVVGVDGCKAGWFAVYPKDGRLMYEMYASLQELWEEHRSASCILLDMPIGLPEDGARYGRECDRQARAILGRRGCTVFSVPIAQALECSDYQEACDMHERLTRQCKPPRRISRQAYALGEKMLKVEEFLRDHRAARRVIRESHPELCFAWLNGGRAIPDGKKSEAGRKRRQALIAKADAAACEVYKEAMKKYARKDVAADDIIDAQVLFLAARESLTALGSPKAQGRHGLPMEIWVPSESFQFPSFSATLSSLP